MIETFIELTEDVLFRLLKCSSKKFKRVCPIGATFVLVLMAGFIAWAVVTPEDRIAFIILAVLYFIFASYLLVITYFCQDKVIKKRIRAEKENHPEFDGAVSRYVFYGNMITANLVGKEDQMETYKYEDIRRIFEDDQYMFIQVEQKKYLAIKKDNDEKLAQLKILLINKGKLK